MSLRTDLLWSGIAFAAHIDFNVMHTGPFSILYAYFKPELLV